MLDVATCRCCSQQTILGVERDGSHITLLEGRGHQPHFVDVGMQAQRSEGLAEVTQKEWSSVPEPPPEKDGIAAMATALTRRQPWAHSFISALYTLTAQVGLRPAAPHTSGVLFTPYLTRLRSPSVPQPSEG